MPDTDRRTVQLPSDRDSSGRDLGNEELALLEEALRSGHLNSTGGTMVPRFERAFATKNRLPHAIACASGSAAVHTAIASLGLKSGDEVITTSITDMGAILPILYEGLIPVFADVDPLTANLTADSIEAKLSERSRAVIVTHLFGQACEMAPILALAKKHKLRVIEDCAQAFLATEGENLVGTFGDISIYSFQQGKHMTTGEGGIVVSADADLADAAFRFVNKGWGYGDANPDHDRPGLNYRMTELQAAVGIAQLEKLDGCVNRRRTAAEQLHEQLAGLPGITVPAAREGSEHSYWRYALLVDSDVIPGGSDALGKRLSHCGVHNAPRYIRKPAFECAVFARALEYPVMSLAYEQSPRTAPEQQDRDQLVGTYAALEQLLVLPWNEHYTTEHVQFIAESIRSAHSELTQR